MLFASALLLAGCGGGNRPAVYALKKANGDWCAVASEAESAALRGRTGYQSGTTAAIHFREGGLVWSEYTIEDQRGQIRDTYTFDRSASVHALTRTGLIGNAPKLYVWYKLGEDGKFALTSKAERNIQAHKAAGHGTVWLSSPIYSTYASMPFAGTVRLGSTSRAIRRAC